MRSDLRTALCFLLYYLLPRCCDGGNPYSSSVLALNIRNWRREVDDYHHNVFVMICNTSNHTDCNGINGSWERFANSGAANYVKIAYWDSEQGRRPEAFGSVEVRNGSEYLPLLRLYVPKKNQEVGTFKEKELVDFPLSRTLQNTTENYKQFAFKHISLYSDKISGGERELETFNKKAKKHGLPRALYFVAKPESTPLTKHVTTEFRKRLLLAEIQPSVYNKPLLKKYGIKKVPALLVLPEDEDGDPIHYKGEFKLKNVENFLADHALKERIILPGEKKKASTEKEHIEKEEL